MPGEYATLEAHRALTRGMHVFLFSDHVSLEDEIELKRRGAELGLLVMGPECGTAMLAGVGLGFANVVRPGPVGVVAAAGTGAQEVACLIDAAGSGVSHIIGVGGRDLSTAVGGTMLRQGHRDAGARRADRDAAARRQGARGARRARRAPSPTASGPSRRSWAGRASSTAVEVHATLEAAALAAAGAAARPTDERRRGAGARRRRVLGLFSGGSLAHEACDVLEPLLGAVATGPRRSRGTATSSSTSARRSYTQGRPHPMVDLTCGCSCSRRRSDDDAGCVLLDVVCGHGAHPDPASRAGGRGRARRAPRRGGRPRLRDRRRPAGRLRQAATLRDAGAVVAPSNAAAARLAARAIA